MIKVSQNALFAFEELLLNYLDKSAYAVICVFSAYYSQIQIGNALCK